MLQRTNHIFIGKDISRDAQVVDGASLATITLSTGLANGEIVVLDKFKKVLAAGATKLDSDIIYICQGTGETFSYTNEAGTAITGARKIVCSDPIEGAKVKNFKARAYVAKAERTAAFTYTGYTPVANTEYLVRIIYKDMHEHPARFTQTYRITATAAQAVSVQTLVEALVAKINKHTGRRVIATEDNATITLTGLPKPESTSGLSDLDAFDMVDFEARFLYVDANGNWAVIPATSTTVTYTGPTYGSGNWEQVRDMERDALGYEGVTNTIYWPTKVPTQDVVVGATYNILVIEHDRSYLSPDNQYIKQAPLTTVVAFVVPTTGTQQTNVLARLNPWMESFGFDSVSF